MLKYECPLCGSVVTLLDPKLAPVDDEKGYVCFDCAGEELPPPEELPVVEVVTVEPPPGVSPEGSDADEGSIPLDDEGEDDEEPEEAGS